MGDGPFWGMGGAEERRLFDLLDLFDLFDLLDLFDLFDLLVQKFLILFGPRARWQQTDVVRPTESTLSYQAIVPANVGIGITAANSLRF